MNEPETSRTRSEKEIFFEALDKNTPEERAAFLDGACGRDSAMRARVEALLADHFQGDSFMKKPAVEGGRTTIKIAPISEAPGTVIGRYKLLQQIGEGGCGIVYMAEQQEPVSRRVALKVIKLGMDTKSVIARFEAERQALAVMDHPNIAKVLDAGATQTGRPYFVMELVRGTKITDYCDQNNLSTRERLDLFIQICHAIQHAHQKGIIHRDIKPSNVLVTMNDGVPMPKVIDFGIAKATTGKLTDQTLFTAFEQFIGTPAYMSPEQAEMSALDIDTRSDIYSLGVLLYELLTGQTPFNAKELLQAGLDEIRRTIREQEPARPSTCLSTMQGVDLTAIAKHRKVEPPSLLHLVRGDLDWIVMKALEKDRTRRYETANGLAADLKRHLANEPVIACPPSAGYKLRKAIRRNKVAFAAAAAVMGVLLIGIGVSTWEAMLASRARNRAREANQQLRAQISETESAKKLADQAAQSEGEQRRRSESMLEHIQLQKAEELLSAQQSSLGVAYLGKMLRANPSNEVAAARLASAILRPFVMPTMEPLRHENNVNSAQFSLDGLRVVTASDDKTARVWDAHTGQPLTEPLRHDQEVASAQFSPDGLRVVTASKDKTARVWDARTGLPLTNPLRHEDAVRSAQFSPDSLLVVTASEDKSARVWDARTGLPLTKPLAHNGWVLSAQFSPDGLRVATTSGEGTARVWDALTGLALGEPLHHQDQVNSAQFSADGLKIVTTSRDKTARIWDALTGHPLTEPLRHDGNVGSAQFSPDGLWVVTTSDDKTARVWDARGGTPLNEPLRHEGVVTSAQFSPDGSKVVTASQDKAWVWDAHTGHSLAGPLRHENTVADAEFSPDGSKVVTASADKTARVWDARTGQPLTGLFRHDAELSSAQFGPDGSRVVTASNDKTARVWDACTGQALGDPLQHESLVISARFSPDGLRVVTASLDKTARVWDARTGLPLTEPLRHSDWVFSARFSSDGLRVVTASADKNARVWEVVPVPVPVPTWFLDWAEARVGRRFAGANEGGAILFSEVRRQWGLVQSRTDTNYFTRLAQWVQADPSTRPISPNASLTTSEYVNRRIAENTPSSLHEALHVSPNDSLAWACLAGQVGHRIAENTRSSGVPPLSQSDPESVAWAWQALRAKHEDGDQNDLLLTVAERSAHQALQLDSQQAEAWKASGITQWLRNKPAEALASLDRALALRSDAGETWELKGDILEHEERHPEALEAYNRRIALLPLTDKTQGGPRCRALDKHAAVCRKMGRWSEAVADLRSGGVPARDPAAEARLVDLSAFYNLELGGGDLATMLTGIHTLDGTRFDARGCLFLASGKLYPNRVPDQMLGIPVALTGRRIRLLHGTFFGRFDPLGTPIGKYVLHFADGTALERPLVLGRDVLDTHADPPPPGDGNATIAWAVEDPKAGPGNKPERLYVTTWDNPHPETEIVSLDFISFRTTAAPFLVAVTIE